MMLFIAMNWNICKYGLDYEHGVDYGLMFENNFKVSDLLNNLNCIRSCLYENVQVKIQVQI